MVVKFKSEKMGGTETKSELNSTPTTKQGFWEILSSCINKTMHLLSTLCFFIALILLIMLEVTEHPFLEESIRLNLPTLGWNLGPAVYLVFWLSIMKLVWDALCLAKYCYSLCTGSSNPIEGLLDCPRLPGLSQKSFSTYLFQWAMCSIFLCLVDGLVLWNIEFDVHQQFQNLFILQIGACLWVLSYNLALHSTENETQSKSENGNLEGVSTC